MSTKKKLALYSVLTIVVLLRFFYSSSKFSEGADVVLQGHVLTQPVITSLGNLVTLNNLKVLVPKESDVQLGDFLWVRGIFKDGVVNATKVSTRPSAFELFNIRKRLIYFFERNLPEPHSALVLGMVIGAKGNLPYAFRQQLQLTGTSHVVVASGMNVTLVAGFVFNLLIKMVRRRYALALSLMSIWLYVALSGMEAPLLRAAIMVSLVFVSGVMGKISQTVHVLILTALAMLLYNPLWINEIGFQLSFAATLSLILFESKVDRLLLRVPTFLREGFSTSLAAQVLVSPLILIHFGRVSLIGPLVNGLVLWTVPFITVIGMTVGMLSLLVNNISSVLVWLLYPFTWWFWGVVNLVI